MRYGRGGTAVPGRCTLRRGARCRWTARCARTAAAGSRSTSITSRSGRTSWRAGATPTAPTIWRRRRRQRARRERGRRAAGGDMKTIVAGSTRVTDAALVARAIASAPWDVTEVVSGCARGVDTLGEAWAEAHGVPVTRFPADWRRYGKGAGPVRNRQMARYADALVAVFNGTSAGTANMIAQARQRGLRLHIVADDVTDGG